jgi:hypothetical protein
LTAAGLKNIYFLSKVKNCPKNEKTSTAIANAMEMRGSAKFGVADALGDDDIETANARADTVTIVSPMATTLAVQTEDTAAITSTVTVDKADFLEVDEEDFDNFKTVEERDEQAKELERMRKQIARNATTQKKMLDELAVLKAALPSVPDNDDHHDVSSSGGGLAVATCTAKSNTDESATATANSLLYLMSQLESRSVRDQEHLDKLFQKIAEIEEGLLEE